MPFAVFVMVMTNVAILTMVERPGYVLESENAAVALRVPVRRIRFAKDRVVEITPVTMWPDRPLAPL